MNNEKKEEPLIIGLLQILAFSIAGVSVLLFLIGGVLIGGGENLGLAFARLLIHLGCGLSFWICAEVIALLSGIRDQLAASNKSPSHAKLLEDVTLLADEARERKLLKKQETIEQAAKQAAINAGTYKGEW